LRSISFAISPSNVKTSHTLAQLSRHANGQHP